MKRVAIILSILAVLSMAAQAVDVDILIQRRNNHRPTEADSAMCWTKGDIVHAQVAGGPLGAAAPQLGEPGEPFIGDFYVVTVTDVDVPVAKNWLLAQGYVGEGEGRVIDRLRLRRLNWKLVPAAKRATLKSTGRATVAWTALVNLVKNQKTGGQGE